jgi:hypothetical protein
MTATDTQTRLTAANRTDIIRQAAYGWLSASQTLMEDILSEGRDSQPASWADSADSAVWAAAIFVLGADRADRLSDAQLLRLEAESGVKAQWAVGSCYRAGEQWAVEWGRRITAAQDAA